MRPQTPLITVDALILLQGMRLVLVERRHFPHGWAIPGGFVDPGESLARAARREALEETGLEITLKEMLHVYSTPWRDPRGDTVSVVYTAEAAGEPRAGDDAALARAFPLDELPLGDMAFDHADILRDYLVFLETGRRPGLER